MNWKRYQNELIVLAAFLLMGMGFLYKYAQISEQQDVMVETKAGLEEIKEVVALKKIWSDNKTTQKLHKLQTLIPENKVQWSEKNKKITASYKGLNDKELNTLVTKILNLPIEIKKLQVKNVALSYDMEFKCQW